MVIRYKINELVFFVEWNYNDYNPEMGEYM